MPMKGTMNPPSPFMFPLPNQLNDEEYLSADKYSW